MDSTTATTPPATTAGSNREPEALVVRRPLVAGVVAGGIFLLGATASMLLLLFTSRAVLKRTVDEDLLNLTRVAVARLDREAHARLVSTNQLNNPEYLQVVAPLKEILAATKGLQYIYTVRGGTNGVRFGVDAADPVDKDGDGVVDQAVLGEAYDEAPAAIRQALLTGQARVSPEPYTDKWGTFMGGFMPVRDAAGAVECVLAVEMNAAEYQARLAAMSRAAWSGIGLAGLASVGIAFGVFWVQRGRQLTLAEIAESEARFRDMADASPVLIWMSGVDSQCTYFNRGWLEFTGRTLAQEAGSGWADGVHPDDLERCVKTYRAHFAVRQPFDMEYRLRRHDGEFRWIVDRGVPRFTPKGEFLGFIGVCFDIADRKRAEEELKASRDSAENANRLLQSALESAEQLTREAQAANRAKSDFLATMSHEIRTPMNGILGFVDLLGKTDQTAEQQEFTGTIRSSAESLLSIINDILDLSKIEAGQLELDRVQFDPVEPVRAALGLLSARAGQKGLGLSLDVRPGAPALVVGDPTRFRQVVVNLVGNALKFTEHGRIVVELDGGEESGPVVSTADAAAGTGGRRLVVRVIDTGIGIPAEKLPRLFAKFSQVDSSSTRRHGGTGLGLAISRELVERMQGGIGVESRPGEGSVFWFTLPAVAASGAALAPTGGTVVPVESPAGPDPDRSIVPVPTVEAKREAVPGLASRPVPSPGAAAGSGVARILVAEDNRTNQILILHLLRKLGCEVELVDDGRKAVTAIAGAAPGRYDLVLMDLNMPELDGLDACREIRALEARESRARVPICAVTANAMLGDQETCLAAGMDDYLSKPIRPDLLAGVVARWAGGADQASRAA